MRLDVNDKNVFDKWRELYSVLTDQEQKQFYNDLEKKYPTQKCFTIEPYREFFKEVDNVVVAEFGGWKGELSKELMDEFKNIIMWTNFELCENAIAKTVNTNKGYYAVMPNNFRWFKEKREFTCDVFIASHSIEHISDSDFLDLVIHLKGIKYIIFEAPIKNTENNWKGYLGTHILTLGWDSIKKIMHDLNYRSLQLDQDVYLFTKVEL